MPSTGCFKIALSSLERFQGRCTALSALYLLWNQREGGKKKLPNVIIFGVGVEERSVPNKFWKTYFQIHWRSSFRLSSLWMRWALGEWKAENYLVSKLPELVANLLERSKLKCAIHYPLTQRVFKQVKRFKKISPISKSYSAPNKQIHLQQK